MGNSDHGTTYMRVGGDNGELRPWHYIYVYSIESRLILRVRYDSHIRIQVKETETPSRLAYLRAGPPRRRAVHARPPHPCVRV